MLIRNTRVQDVVFAVRSHSQRFNA